MSSKQWSSASFSQRLTDVLKGIDSIVAFTHAMDRKGFVADEKTQSAVEFQLIIISEACAKILDMRANVAKNFPDVPWTRVRALANVLRHEYGRVDPAIIWNTVRSDDLANLAKAIQRLRDEG